MARTKEDVATSAFLMIGGNPVDDFSDDSAEAELADQLYEDEVRGLLTEYDWTFARDIKQMSRDATAPDTLWDAAYSLPPTCLAVRTVLVEERSIEYEIYGTKVYCDATVDDTVFVSCLIRPDEYDWPVYFAQTVHYKLASVFGGGLARDGDLVKAYDEKAFAQLRIAKKIDGQSDTTKTFRTTRLTSARRIG